MDLPYGCVRPWLVTRNDRTRSPVPRREVARHASVAGRVALRFGDHASTRLRAQLSVVPSTQKGTSMQHRVVVVGGGFGGLQAVRHLRRAPVSITLVDRQNYHLFQPLAYQVATGALSAARSRPRCGRSSSTRERSVVLAEVDELDLEGRRIFLGELAERQRRPRARRTTPSSSPAVRATPTSAIPSGRRRARAEIARRRTRHPQPHPHGLRGGGGRGGPERRGKLAHLRRRRRRPDRRRDGRPDRRARPRDPAARVPLDRSEPARVLLVEAGERMLHGFPDRSRARRSATSSDSA